MAIGKYFSFIISENMGKENLLQNLPIIFSRNILSRKTVVLEFKESILEILANRNKFSKITGYGHFSFRNTLGTLFAGLFATGVLNHLAQIPIQEVFKMTFSILAY